MSATDQTYMTARRQLLSRPSVIDDDGAAGIRVDQLADHAGRSQGSELELAVAPDAMATLALERVADGGLLLGGVHAGVAETGVIVEWLVRTAGIRELFLALPMAWDEA